MKATQKKICILALVCLLVSLFAAPASALASDIATEQKVVLYYPNGDWGLTPVESTLSVDEKDNFYLLALQKLTTPAALPVDCYDEFPESFDVEDVNIVKGTAYITISDAAFKDSELSDLWLKTLGNIIGYNLFYMNEKLESVKFLSSATATRSLDDVVKSDLFAAPSIEGKKNAPHIDLDYESLAKMSEEERNQTIQDAINKAVGTLRVGEDYTVCIDPGHGGYKPGAVVDGVEEKDLNLDIALAMRDYLEGIDPPYPTFDVIMTRTSDVHVSLADRADIANDEDADIFVSIHCNANDDSSERGTTAIYPNNHDAALSEDLGNEMIEALTPSPLPKHRDAYYDSFQVLRETTMPATLVECGFMTNSDDLEILQDDGDDLGYYLGIAANVWCQVNL